MVESPSRPTQQKIKLPTSTPGVDIRSMARADQEMYAKQEKEFASEAGRADREAFAQKLHKKNLHHATSFLHKKGLWRVRLNQTCEILDIVSGAKGGPPIPGEFSFKSQGPDGEAPTFGSLSRLDAMQTNYAQTLIVDLQKVSRARELAYQHQQACEAEGTGEEAAEPIKQYLDSVTSKAGNLPPSKSEVQEARREREAREAAARAAHLEAEKRAALEALGVSDGGDGGLNDAIKRDRERERKKAQKKARQKAKKAAAAEGAEPSEVDVGAMAGAEDDLDEEVASFERLLRGEGAGAGTKASPIGLS